VSAARSRADVLPNAPQPPARSAARDGGAALPGIGADPWIAGRVEAADHSTPINRSPSFPASGSTHRTGPTPAWAACSGLAAFLFRRRSSISAGSDCLAVLRSLTLIKSGADLLLIDQRNVVVVYHL
jgi:hypothetical protein